MIIPQLRVILCVVVLFFFILYIVVKTAVRKGIVAAYHDILGEKKHDKMIQGIMTGGAFSASKEEPQTPENLERKGKEEWNESI